jgi:hypothetical protein
MRSTPGPRIVDIYLNYKIVLTVYFICSKKCTGLIAFSVFV